MYNRLSRSSGATQKKGKKKKNPAAGHETLIQKIATKEKEKKKRKKRTPSMEGFFYYQVDLHLASRWSRKTRTLHACPLIMVRVHSGMSGSLAQPGLQP